MPDYLEGESALDGLIERGELGALIEKVGEYAPAVADLMDLLFTLQERVTSERLDEFAEQCLDLRRTNVAIAFALLHDAYEILGGIMCGFDVDEWLGETEAYDAAGVARSDLGLALDAVARELRPGNARE